ncbi:RNA-splicing ligase RtcB, repairs tRNA damage [Eubacterium ruminantium]|uniref:3'-phosphate/5'-hydroxy nucleic acid ligase n=1 Tax=Eubacterium ruminantium TaxID=42322 RepID=A0A1T4PSP0_9FIRM|nr:RtcB family protein [Eubacterium ruminantium]SCW62612.1 RNA-splicing ligase RtcB, repairs tRNA damage [Eubacterium ruminantium]SDN15142.1 RNA-splicing ligase RtcB, repairs tRNA damage [Eubacterium ruminantium]SJZ94565.1 RNA-splicing ligase RtcB, repairs tRNA damage [Eubacterium ruminantium]
MITIYGKYTNATVYTVENELYALDEYARKQIQMICNHPSAEGSTIRIMPDVHPGKVGTIGLTMTVESSILPSLVGVDIGCGMTIAKIKAKGMQFQQLDSVIRDNVPVGPRVRKKEHKYSAKIDLSGLKCAKNVDMRKADLSIGTLGGGNHFIELDKDEEGNIYLVVHSGSRHLGIEVAEHYLRIGQKEMQMKKSGFASYEMTCLTDSLMEDYLHDIGIIQEFAKLNREAIIETIVSGMKWKVEESFTCIHNYVDFSDPEKSILRKGAISAKEGERVIIPINMRDGIILGTGLGNDEWNCSAPHGAGRIYKRSEVAEHHTVSDFKKAMEGIHSICISKGTLDESPFAYRNIDDIANVIGETVRIDKIIKPVYNYKAGGEN